MDHRLRMYEPISRQFKSKDYILHAGLKNAVEVALALDQPLLLTGEPGTGKTKLAFKVADMLSQQDERFLDKPLIFNTKTTAAARDLFYTYDALSHFQASNIKKSDDGSMVNTADFIELQALGKAIAQTAPEKLNEGIVKTKLDTKGRSTVVLIDEIDKAPRDFSNDILNEIENYRFEIKEQDNYEVKRGEGQRILVIMTSNSEKNLPDAFLRRCVFYHIPFPSPELLFKIVKAQIGKEKLEDYKFTNQALDSLVDRFDDIRKASTRKKPATAELVSWVRMLGMNGYMEKTPADQKELMLQNLSILVKTQEDLVAVKELINKATAEE